MLKLFSKNTFVSAASIQNALSYGKDHKVKNQNLIHQATAVANGFDSFEQMQSLLDRANMIDNHFWVEQSQFNKSMYNIMVGDIKIYIGQGTFILRPSQDRYMLDSEMQTELNGMLLSDATHYGLFEFNKKENSLTYTSEKNHHEKIVFIRYKDEEYEYLEINLFSENKFMSEVIPLFRLSSDYTDVMYCETQQTRMLAEYCMASEFDLLDLADDLSVSKETIKNTIATAFWKFEVDKGYDVSDMELEPEKKVFKQIAPLAYLAFTHRLTKDITRNIYDSMSLFDDDSLEAYEELRSVLYNEYNWYKLTYIPR